MEYLESKVQEVNLIQCAFGLNFYHIDIIYKGETAFDGPDGEKGEQGSSGDDCEFKVFIFPLYCLK